MRSNNFWSYLSIIILETLGKILYFPLWWYSVGLLKKIKSLWRFLGAKQENLGFSVWLKNIFVPMYGQRDFAGRIISFVIRLVQVIVRGLILLIWFFLALLALLSWLLLPVLLFLALIFQIF
jgi:small-conductance mechanosensitive channel